MVASAAAPAYLLLRKDHDDADGPRMPRRAILGCASSNIRLACWIVALSNPSRAAARAKGRLTDGYAGHNKTNSDVLCLSKSNKWNQL